MKQGLKHGFGSMTFATGHRYEGEWRKGLMNGKGKFIHKEVMK